jgi:hypothetical protein
LQISWPLGLFFAALVLLMFNGHLLDFWMVKRRFRKSPYWKDSIISKLTAEGLHTVGRNTESKLGWAVITKACSFGDGLLLFQGPGVFNWLPDDALVDGNRAEVEDLVQSHVKDHRIVEQNPLTEPR